MEAALVNHLIARMDADVDFLAQHHVLHGADAELIRQRLRSAADSHALTSGVNSVQLLNNTAPSPAPSFGHAGPPSSTSVSAPPPPPPPQPQQAAKQQCRALWDYPQAQPDDLAFVKGDIITIEKEENADWWRGSLNGRTGIFPSNHVERIASALPAPPPASYGSVSPTPSFAPSQTSQQPQYVYQQPQGYGNLNEKHPYAESQHAQSGASLPGPSNLPVNNFHTYNPPAGLTTVQPAQPGEKPKKDHKFAKHMGTSFAGGAGFGAGAAVTSNIINAIF
ncbi:hypothetical protein ACM66B_007073 [Microbotryomycetes sp. NB124-2]